MSQAEGKLRRGKRESRWDFQTLKTTQEDPQERLETFKEHRTNWLSRPYVSGSPGPNVQRHAPAWSLQLRDENTLEVLGTTDKYRYDYNKQGIQYLDLLLQKVNKNRNQPREPGGTLENAPVFHQWLGEPQFCTVAEPRLSPPPLHSVSQATSECLGSSQN